MVPKVNDYQDANRHFGADIGQCDREWIYPTSSTKRKCQAHWGRIWAEIASVVRLPVQESFELLQRIYRIPETQYHYNVEVFDELLSLGDFFQTPVAPVESRSADAC